MLPGNCLETAQKTLPDACHLSCRVDKHEHPTRIPTPISFSRPLLNGRASESNEYIEEPTKCGDTEPPALDEGSKDDSKAEAPAFDGRNSPVKTPADLRQPRFTISLEEINRFLNSQRSAADNKFKSKTTSAILTTLPHADSTSLHSTGYPVAENSASFSAFAPVAKSLNGNTKPELVGLRQNSLDSNPSDVCKLDRFRSCKIDINHNETGYRDNQRRNGFRQDKDSGGRDLKQGSFIESQVKQNGFRETSTPKTASIDKQWV